MKKIVFILLLALIAATAFAGESGASGDTDDQIIGRWRWISVTLGVGDLETGEASSDYLLTFEADGTLIVRADCRTGSGRYSADGSTLTLSLNDMTTTNCQAGSLADDFERLLTEGAVFEYSISAGTQLDLSFGNGAGKAQFLKTNDAM